MYTSGTTGKPKGVVRNHECYIAHYLLNNINMGVLPTDKPILVMPTCHVNSIYYSFCTYVAAPVMIYNTVSFEIFTCGIPAQHNRWIDLHGNVR